MDLSISILLMAITALPMAIIALLIKIDSRGPVLFSPKRVGKDGKTFLCYKFRTMYADAQQCLDSSLEGNPGAQLEWETCRKLRKDPRVTRLGPFLRRSSLDELPQLFNVFKGEMSIVGPRPVLEDEIEKYYKEKAAHCFSVQPGITGLWQVSGRASTPYDARVDMDMWYATHWNFGTDLSIVLRTVPAIMKRTGAY
jgi:undecaprenyl-phosphate galactose phosphotransferase